MHILQTRESPGTPGNPDYFTGSVLLKKVEEDCGPAQLFRVEFAPGARTHWHTHTGVQLLVVLAGRCRFQHWDGPVQEAGVGETIHIPPGEKHWHGATAGEPMVHLAINLALETTWLEAVAEV